MMAVMNIGQGYSRTASFPNTGGIQALPLSVEIRSMRASLSPQALAVSIEAADLFSLTFRNLDRGAHLHS